MIPKVETTFFFFFPPCTGALKCHRSDQVVGSVFFCRARRGNGGGKTEDFTGFMALCRLDLLSVSSLEGAEEQSWHGKIVEKCISYLGWGQKVMKVGLVKAERVPGTTAVLEP